MATMTSDLSRDLAFNPADINQIGLKASTTLYQGQLLGLSSGAARALVAADAFCGIADQQASNSTATDGNSQSTYVRVISVGILQNVSVAGSTPVVGNTVYALDDLSLTKASTGNSLFGVICGKNTDGTFNVHFNASTHKTV